MKTICLGAALTAAVLAATATAAFAQAGTVDAYTPADEAKAKAAVSAAGYTPGMVATAQAGNLFLSATKGADKYFVTVTADGHVYPGPALGAAPGPDAAAAAMAPPAGRGGRGAPPSGGD
jgi:hypothetical protein